MNESQAPASGSSPGLRPRRAPAVSLVEIAGLIGGEIATPEIMLNGVTLDSRAVRRGDLYLALPGLSSHGAKYAAQAAQAGAAAILTDQPGAEMLRGSPAEGLPLLIVPEPQRWVGRIAERIYRDDSAGAEHLQLFGITGTNGKTTTSYLVRSILAALGRRSGLIGTIETLVGEQRVDSTLTTPAATDLQALFALMREESLDAAVMEVSSHALTLGRVDQVVFDVAGFTNLTQDHLDLHGEMTEYFAAKASLFSAEHAKAAVVTIDDEWGSKMAAAAGVPVTTLRTTLPEALVASAEGLAEADWHVRSAVPQGLGWQVELAGEGKSLTFRTSLPGEFNVSNAALAVLMVHVSGVSIEDLQAALDQFDPLSIQVPGRMQLICREPISVVDFAHNPDALHRAMEAVRPAHGDVTGQLIVVFGATGQRDQSKREIMGALAARHADVVIVTDDDPHDEDPAQIRDQVFAGALHSAWDDTRVENVAPRAAAIDRAVELASAGDRILVAGRGHEVWQEVSGVNLALDDREELRTALRKYGFTPEPLPEIES
ncbi:UDP-N-acetylmuramoyl-L-alanyl-D-glutamate--2,6-diaminopimelate ligase [Psychromicrobium lacuslunae]|uniref:UDP-N-acetylmuramyl-tripeptide synthetase n=1 Tax=Psychromicrobium lacuslunae TaxID=1618207 RepID=A0A0D4BWL2_9MICC|nr:UDP-N-acetylmuramoyl-L-alanyl-D-glutamate--2,6-diaminopimelate ligase [Psychromicrobium lacuslunae]AJT40713.1 UDP-N-acetylmuramoylalanyl-D-glutamate--2,6-diaminopimelate ligase [Psychromicrobium lacuslunae]